MELFTASWGTFSRFRGVPSGCGAGRWRSRRLRRAVFLSPVPTCESWIVRRESWLPPFPLVRRYERDRDSTGRVE